MFTARSDPARALALFEAAERAGLRDPELLFAKADVLYQMGRAREGVELQRQLSALDPGNPNLSSVLWFNLVAMREPVAALQTLALAQERFPAFDWQQLRARTVYSFTGNLEPLAPYSDPRLVAEAPARNQAQDDALRNIAERIAFRGRYGDARDLLDTYARIELFGNNVVTYYAVEGAAPQPTAEMRGWLSLILDDAAGAAGDGRRVLDFLDRTAETPANAWFRRYLRAAARSFLGEHDAAVADARALLELTAATNRTNHRVVGELLAARIFAWAGQEDAAVALLERLATDLPGLPPADIALEPRYAVPLRDHAGFRALVARLDAQMAATRLE
jgi:predicted Zn-dependent protease